MISLQHMVWTNRRRITLGAGLLGLLVLLAIWRWSSQLLDAPLESREGEHYITVEAGDSLRAVLERLSDSHSLDYPEWAARLAAWHGLDRGLHVGEYRITPRLSTRGLLDKINRGEVVHYTVTLPEGITLQKAIALLQSATPLQATLSGADDSALLALVESSGSAEGWFLPDTYQFVRGDTDFDILKRAYRLMTQVLNEAWEERDPASPLKNPYEALILASIVERETSVPHERSTIAGVFTRRLQAGMRLQTDPTVIYGLGDAYDGNLTRQHLKDATNRWNTYRHSGLPPTPIALPGRAAVMAAVKPAEGDSLYFVATGAGDHVFAATLDEHNANVQRYQLRRRQDYRSTPPPSSE